jgi:hypothetical protein
MFTWLKRRLIIWTERYQQRETERLHEEGCRLKEEMLKLTGEERIRLSPEECRLLTEKAKGIEPKVFKQISLFDAQDLRPPSPNDTATESP